MQVHRVTPGRRVPARLAGAVLARDLTVVRRALVEGPAADARTTWRRSAAADPGEPVSVLVPDPGELHEDDAAVRLATAVAGSGVTMRGPAESRVDLVAEADGVLNVRVADLERLNRIDPLEVFTAFDGQVVARGDLVASVKIAPHLVDAADRGRGAGSRASAAARWSGSRRSCRAGSGSSSRNRSAASPASGSRRASTPRSRASARRSSASSTSRTTPTPSRPRWPRFVRRPDPVDLILTAGAASTDPLDACFVAIAALGGRVVRRGVPAHPGSMLWLARIGSTAILGLPDLWRLLEGDRGGPAPAAPPVGEARRRSGRSPSSATAAS